MRSVANASGDLRFDNTTFMQHLYTGVGAICRLMEAHIFSLDEPGFFYANPFSSGVTGIHISNNITSGLLHAAGIHPGPIDPRAIGWDHPTPISFFRRQ